MDEPTFKERVKRLKAVDTVVKQLDAAFRDAAVELLKDYVTSTPSAPGQAHRGKKADKSSGVVGNPPEFFDTHQGDDDTEVDNLVLAAAFHFSQYGDVEFSTEELRTIAGEAGVDVPDRIDVALKRKKDGRGGKNMFRKGTGVGGFRPTAAGRRYFVDTYKVKKGTKKKPAEGNE
jgi:hypothetical protein